MRLTDPTATDEECGYPRPTLAAENWEAWELWEAVSTQWRIGFGGVCGLDYPPVFQVASVLDIEMTEGLLRKVRVLENLTLERQLETVKKGTKGT